MKNKYVLLFLSLLFDAMGMLSFTVPVLGESFDVIWAPTAAFLIFKMYKGTEGKIAGAVTFIEEAMPGLDIIPTFTITWIYKFVIKKRNNKN